MIQEIYDYLLIRNYLLQDTEILDLSESENPRLEFKYFVDNVDMLTDNEDFILLSDQMIEFVKDIIQKYRFDYLKDNEINYRVNNIISKFLKYKDIPDAKRRRLVEEWYDDECKDRMLPLNYRKRDIVNNLIIRDINNVDLLQDSCKLEEFEGYCGDELKISKLVSAISTINLILNRAPDSLKKEKALEFIYAVASTMELTIDELIYMKRTEKAIIKSMNKEKVLKK